MKLDEVHFNLNLLLYYWGTNLAYSAAEYDKNSGLYTQLIDNLVFKTFSKDICNEILGLFNNYDEMYKSLSCLKIKELLYDYYIKICEKDCIVDKGVQKKIHLFFDNELKNHFDYKKEAPYELIQFLVMLYSHILGHDYYNEVSRTFSQLYYFKVSGRLDKNQFASLKASLNRINSTLLEMSKSISQFLTPSLLFFSLKHGEMGRKTISYLIEKTPLKFKNKIKKQIATYCNKQLSNLTVEIVNMLLLRNRINIDKIYLQKNEIDLYFKKINSGGNT